MSARRFPEGFRWGAATSAQQIEGNLEADGRGESIWDRFAATPGKIADGSTSEPACDHYRLWREDIERMKWLGLNAYRFSIAWPRILPEGTGRVNEAGLDFYERLVDGLLESGIDPFATLYHWDLPQVLEDEGGWTSRSVVDAFVEYASVVTERLGDRVKSWVTHNEPWCISSLGYGQGQHAPGHEKPREALRAAHHLLLSHGRAVEVIRKNAPASEVGIVLNLVPGEPLTAAPEDEDAARNFDGFFNRWFLDPLLRGTYPFDAILDHVNQGTLDNTTMPFVQQGDLGVISQPIDFLGLNYYSRAVLKAGKNGAPEKVPAVPADQLNDMGWEDYPKGLETMLLRLHRVYEVPRLYVTENGGAWPDAPDAEGRVHDDLRIKYMQGHLDAAHRVIEQGVPLQGYFAWSLLDNFEWGHGLDMRFGLYWVDYTTQQRIAKQSAHWYRQVTTTNALDTNSDPDRAPST